MYATHSLASIYYYEAIRWVKNWNFSSYRADRATGTDWLTEWYNTLDFNAENPGSNPGIDFGREGTAVKCWMSLSNATFIDVLFVFNVHFGLDEISQISGVERGLVRLWILRRTFQKYRVRPNKNNRLKTPILKG